MFTRTICERGAKERRVVVVVVVGWGLMIHVGKKGPDNDDVRFSTAYASIVDSRRLA